MHEWIACMRVGVMHGVASVPCAAVVRALCVMCDACKVVSVFFFLLWEKVLLENMACIFQKKTGFCFRALVCVYVCVWFDLWLRQASSFCLPVVTCSVIVGGFSFLCRSMASRFSVKNSDGEGTEGTCCGEALPRWAWSIRFVVTVEQERAIKIILEHASRACLLSCAPNDPRFLACIIAVLCAL